MTGPLGSKLPRIGERSRRTSAQTDDFSPKNPHISQFFRHERQPIGEAAQSPMEALLWARPPLRT